MPKHVNWPVSVDNVVLIKQGEYAVVQVCVGGKYYEMIRERIDAPFNHCVHASGIRDVVENNDPVFVPDSN